MHVADLDDLIHIHAVMAADLCQLIGESDIDGTESIFHHLGHLCRADVRYHDLPLAESAVKLLDLFANFPFVCADGAVVVQQLIHHVAGNDPLRGMHQMNVLTDGKAILLNHRANVLVNGSRGNSGFDDHRGTLGTDLHHVLDGGHHIAGIHLFAEFVIGRGHGHDVSIRHLILRSEANAALHSIRKELIQSFFLEGGLACIQGGHQFRIVVRADHIHTVGSHH